MKGLFFSSSFLTLTLDRLLYSLYLPWPCCSLPCLCWSSWPLQWPQSSHCSGPCAIMDFTGYKVGHSPCQKMPRTWQLPPLEEPTAFSDFPMGSPSLPQPWSCWVCSTFPGQTFIYVLSAYASYRSLELTRGSACALSFPLCTCPSGGHRVATPPQHPCRSAGRMAARQTRGRELSLAMSG
jgi:hypothetical protein